MEDHPDRGRLAPGDQRQLVRTWIEDELAGEHRRRLVHREPAWDRDAEVAVLRAVENAIWGLGRLQELLELPGVEDIHIVGADRPQARARAPRACFPAVDAGAFDEAGRGCAGVGGFAGSPRRVARARLSSMSRMASQSSLTTASSVGKCPRFLMIFRSW